MDRFRMAGTSLHRRCGHHERGGAFKLRGATNAVASLTQDEAARGGGDTRRETTPHGAGDRGRATGHRSDDRDAGRRAGDRRAAVEGYGARIVSCGPTLADREGTLADVVAKSEVPRWCDPYDDARIVAGQATAAIRLFRASARELDVVIAPIGVAGCSRGTVLAAKFFSPGTRVIGAEPALADDAAESLRLGERQPQRPPRTVADGLRTAIGAIPFEVLRTHDVEVRTVSEEDIVRAMRTTWERAKLPIEASSAVAVAVAIDGGFASARVGVVLSGGNVDLTRLPWQ
ncbi:MAG: pyridoxal-phosphate dependent enzyme [Polyangiales bacterium]